ncbi:hypothetical protein ODJ79_32200 [Actinoplanes sp. KI2]|uniref:hypothetical protein n=1 Tax=Actinoplanes sp. KI2 TaxID=2983315 RepID=UPI0021D598A6|nr:hypothetical protein [Actinoplanes sp. KI2]MCU7728397.1 hypothetical protein [Actinoplanes sp. KI2]
MLLRLAYLGVTNAFALLRLLPSVWEILRLAGIDPAPDRAATTLQPAVLPRPEPVLVGEGAFRRKDTGCSRHPS